MTVVPTGVRSDESGLLARLTLEQKVHLLTGADSWALHAESAVGLRQLITSDGRPESGARASTLPTHRLRCHARSPSPRRGTSNSSKRSRPRSDARPAAKAWTSSSLPP